MASTSNPQDTQIQQVRISGFKRIRNTLDVDLSRPLTILVGDNGVGKTTILEAIHLALTGLYRGESIRRALSQTLFNSENVGSFLEAAAKHNLIVLPCITIEVFLSGGDVHVTELFSGAVNSTHLKRCGFTFSISFDDDYRAELADMISSESLSSLPIEYYEIKWMTFADAPVMPRKLPIRSIMMNPTGEWLGGRADERATRILVDSLSERQQMSLAQDARMVYDQWNGMKSLKAASVSLPKVGIAGMSDIDLAADSGTVDSWKRSVVVRLNAIPYAHIGAGSQSMLQASLALTKQRPDKPVVLLFEEPENHLSHSNLNKLICSIVDGADRRKIVITTHSSFVANTLGLENLQVVGGDPTPACSSLTNLSGATFDFFRKLPGYDTLRLILSRAAILVEGPSDELIVKLAYRQNHGKLPIQDGIDVISVGSGFLRFLELADSIYKPVLVLTDNDGKPDTLEEKYAQYRDCRYVKICYVKTVFQPDDPEEFDKDKKLNWNTLEAELLRKNGLDSINAWLDKSYSSNVRLLNYMEHHKTETALALFDAGSDVSIPDYINEGLTWLARQR